MNKLTNLRLIAGISLIELLVSMVIALIILAGTIQSLGSSKRSFVYEEQIAFIQENARFAVDAITNDVMQAGMFGCASTGDTANVFIGDLNDMVKSTAIEGYEGGVSTFPSVLAANTDTDAFIVRRADGNNGLVVQAHNESASPPTFVTVSAHTHDVGEVMVVADRGCRQSGIFSISAETGNSISHGANTLNRSTMLKGLFEDSNCSSATVCDTGNVGDDSAEGVAGMYDAGATIYPFVANGYFIDDSTFDSSLPALMRVSMNGASGGTPETTTQELVSGVENMQVLYGVDTDGDGAADRYFAADGITADVATITLLGVGWDRVVSLRIQLLMRSRIEILPQTNTTAYFGSTPSDKYLRQIVTTTIQLRNASI